MPFVNTWKPRARQRIEIALGVAITVGMIGFVVWALNTWQQDMVDGPKMIRPPDTAATRQLR